MWLYEFAIVVAFAAYPAAEQTGEYGPLFLEEPEDVTYLVESSEKKVSFRCRASGHPPPLYRWLKNGTEVPITGHYSLAGGSLIVRNPSEGRDGGVFQCLVTNSVGSIISVEARLQFAYLESFRSKHRGTVAVRQGQGVVLICAPPPYSGELTFVWLFNEMYDYMRSDGRRFVSQVTGNLYIAKVEATDVGSYTCMVHNTVTNTRVASPPTPLLIKSGRSMGEYEPRIEVGFSPKTHTLLGHTVRLECFALGNPVPVISWRKIDGQLPSKAYLMEANAVLEIPNFQHEDGGNYECNAENVAGKNSAQGKITVYAPPHWIQPISNVEQGIGDKLSWDCKAGGKPPPTYRWLRNGAPLPSESRFSVMANGELILQELQPWDRGMYQCLAENKHGRIYSHGELRVKASAPDFRSNPMKRVTPAARGGQAVIKCEPKAWPRPSFTWTKGNAMVIDNERMSITQNGSLWIRSVTDDDAGTYTCTVENHLGSANSTGRLILKESTRITVVPSLKMVSVGESIVWPCQASHDPSLDIVFVWSLNGQRIDMEKDAEHYQLLQGQRENVGDLMIKRLQLRHRGNYTCTAQTSVDNTSAWAMLMVRGPPGPPGAVVAEEATSTTVRLAWKRGSNNHSPIISYKIQARAPVASTEWLNVHTSPDIISGDSEQATVVGLTPWMDYEFTVLAINALGESEASRPSRMIKTLSAGPELAPERLGGGGGHQHELVITWQPVAPQFQYGPDFGYILAFRENGTRAWRQVTIPKAESRRYVYRSDNLAPYAPFEVKIKMYNFNGEGPFSNNTIVYSAENAPKVAPSNVTARSLTSAEAEVSWRAPPLTSSAERITGYEIVYWKKFEGELMAESAQTDGLESSAVLQSLTGSTDYQLVVKAYNSGGTGPPSHIAQLITKKPPPSKPPKNIDLKQDGTKVTLHWDPVIAMENESAVTGYKVSYVSLDRGTDKEIITNGTGVEVVLPDGGVYSFEVQAQSDGGLGASSSQMKIPDRTGMKLGRGRNNSAGIDVWSVWGLISLGVLATGRNGLL
ncbi:contactin-4-like isoform X1 [Lampetra fluviatilis]